GAANRFRVDVDRYHPPRMPGGKDRTYSGARAHIQHLRRGSHQLRIELCGKTLAGAWHFRIKHTRDDHERRATHPLDAKVIVAVLTREPVAQCKGFTEELRDERKSQRPERVRDRRRGVCLRIKHWHAAVTENQRRCGCLTHATGSTRRSHIPGEAPSECPRVGRSWSSRSGPNPGRPATQPRAVRE